MSTTSTDEVVFPGPDEIEGFWALDKMHAPRPIAPLSFDLVVKTLGEGFTKAQAEYDCPIMVTHREVNHYFYVAFHPHPGRGRAPGPDDPLPRQAGHDGAERRQDVGRGVEAGGPGQERGRADR